MDAHENTPRIQFYRAFESEEGAGVFKNLNLTPSTVEDMTRGLIRDDVS
jgi:hypothetical protein